MAKRRKVSNMLALPVLAFLIERPMHPYELVSLLKSRRKDRSIKINYSSLYTVVANLEKHGFIEALATHREGRRPERTVYRITESGREELTDWMRELVSSPEKEYSKFEGALSLLVVLPPNEVIGLLHERMRTLESQAAAQKAELEYESKLPRLFHIESEYALALTQLDLEWTRSLLEELETESLPGMAPWRTLHQTGGMPEEWSGLNPEQSETEETNS
ncbi:PadR family transcriptional regulator [Streptomyces sp. FIT100]|uniref:PadR family transcriptional regulator n=1 Tax=Streptomyces sp. FIT100 TaxID=2837956 RepID=UPI0021C71F54|nr:PadR family transcriptional regulator [Streptomyces sp. FIT100]UUN30063.1 PadR family transcriptional regulator [Streptomyces sp. FIT100]